MEKEEFNQISSKLDTIIKLLALGAVQGKDPKDQVLMLSSAGFGPKQIADALGKNPNTVKSILHRSREEQEKETDENIPVASDKNKETPS
jgi:hypothetical protein